MSGCSMSSRSASNETRASTATTETTTPKNANARHQPSAPSKAHHESQPDKPSYPRMTNRSTQEVANPHHPRTLTSTMSAMSPAEAAMNPATDGMSMRRQADRGCSTRYDMRVT